MNEIQNPNSLRRNRKRWWIAGGAIGAVALVGGAGAAWANRSGQEATLDRSPIVASSQALATTSSGDAAADLNAAITAAVEAAGGVGAESVEVDRSGHEVDVQLQDGSDVSAFVASDGTVQVSQERDEPDLSPDPLLATETVDQVVAAVLAHTPDATIRELSTTNDLGHAYDVDAVQPDGTELELELGDDFTVSVEDVDRPGD
jgi:hypothetical protein